MSARPDYFARWQHLDGWLAQHADLWRWLPFVESAPAWRQYRPALAQCVDALTTAECDHLEQTIEELADRLEGVLPGVTAGIAAAGLMDMTATATTLPEVRATDMPGRKRLQAGAFAGALAPVEADDGATMVDWCCGKGHLARTLSAAYQRPVVGLEWNPVLVTDGNRIARRYGDPVTLRIQDVLAPDVCWSAHAHGVALHACGDLHRAFLRTASAGAAPRISLSPCCYGLIAGEYAPMSVRVYRQPERCLFGRNELRLAVQETVTAPARDARRRVQLNQWRLGFDSLQRYLRNLDEYLPVPSAPSRLVHGSFQDFCVWAAGEKQIHLPSPVDYGFWESHGGKRWLEVQRGELLRHLFRRPVEVWLVLDYVLYLEEQGYDVALGTFCARELTPRNILIDAKKAPAGA